MVGSRRSQAGDRDAPENSSRRFSKLSPMQRDEYARNGVLVLRSCLSGWSELDSVIDAIQRLGAGMSREFIWNDTAAISGLGASRRRSLYRALRYLPEVTRLAASRQLIDLAIQLGIRMPAVMHSFNVRLDLPGEDELLFHWHQDITYLLGSENAVTLWIPLGHTGPEHGSVEFIPGSHGSGLLPFRYQGKQSPGPATVLSPRDLRLVEEPTGNGEMIEAERGDLAIFSQLLVHRSTVNRSSKPRWTIQVRYADLMNSRFLDAEYPFGDSTNILHTDYLASRRGRGIEENR